MRRLLKNIFIFGIPILCLFICMEVLVRHIPNDYSHKKKYLDQHADEIEILVLGSSHAFYGVNPVYFSRPSFNAAYVSQSLDYDLSILKKYEGKWNRLKYIVLPIDYFSLFSKLEDGAESWRMKYYNIYYGMHKSDRIQMYAEVLDATFELNARKIYDYYLRNLNSRRADEYGWGNRYLSTIKQRDSFMSISAKSAAARHFAIDHRYFEESKKALRSIMQFAQAKNIGLLLYSSPADPEYIRNLDQRQLEMTIETVSNMARENCHTRYHNFLYDLDFGTRDFYDADHVNEIGAKKLTRKIDSILLNSFPKQ